MDNWRGMLGLVGLVVLAVAPWLIYRRQVQVQRRQGEPRTRELQDLASRMGWEFRGELDASDHPYSIFPRFRSTTKNWALNTIEGRLGEGVGIVKVLAGDCRTSTYLRPDVPPANEFSYMLAHRSTAMPPALSIHRCGVLGKIAGAVGLPEADVGSDEFRRQFRVTGDSEAFARGLCSPSMMQHMLSDAALDIDYREGWLLASEGERLWSAGEFRVSLAWFEKLIELWSPVRDP